MVLARRAPWLHTVVMCMYLMHGAAAAAQSTPLGSERAAWIEARRLTGRAEASFAAGNFEAALVDFARSYELLERHARRYVVLNNLAVCHERLFRYHEALRYYERYLSEGAADAEDRKAVAAVLATLRSLLGTVQVDADVPAEVWLDTDGGSAPRLRRCTWQRAGT